VGIAKAVRLAAPALLLAGCCCDDDFDSVWDGGRDSGPYDAGRDTGCDPVFDPFCDPTPPPRPVLLRPSRSTPIDLDPVDQSFIAMVNPSEGTLSVFATLDNARVSRTAVGAEPSSVVIHPDGSTVFVANRGDGTVVRLTGIGSTGGGVVDATVDVGSEPTGLALSPSGAYLFVAELGESRVAMIHTSTMTIYDTFVVRSPYALAVTNDLDEDDMDEALLVTEFFGRPNASGEVHGEGRDGIVQLRRLPLLSVATEIVLPPIETGFPDDASSDLAFANQLHGIAINADGMAYVTSISASPERPNDPGRTVHSVIYAIDIETSTVDLARTQVLSRRVRDVFPDAPLRHFLADVVAADTIGDAVYAVSRGANVLQRIDHTVQPPGLGVSGVSHIDLAVTPPGETEVCLVPTGVVMTIGNGLDGSTRRAWISCEGTRQMGTVSLSNQALIALTESAPIAADERAANLGMRAFFSARGRWSSESWTSCASCHPGGLSDGVTWRFPDGPRQTPSLDGAFSHPVDAADPIERRVFQWTASFDEIHDFERVVRDVAGGLGAITQNGCSSATETAIDIDAVAGVGRPLSELTSVDACSPTAWDEIEAYVRSIRPPRRRRSLDPAAIVRGRALFESACAHCHGGPGWTVSQRFWAPTSDENLRLQSVALNALPSFGALSTYPTHLAFMPRGYDPVADAIDDAATPDPDGLAPMHAGCGIREVSTFGIRIGGVLDETLTAPLEQRAGDISPDMPVPNRALGAAGYNVPSLYGLQVGAPFLHHGQASTLEALLDPAGPWQVHLRAVHPTFLEGDDGSDRADLIAFLFSIDATTPEVPVPAGFDVCTE
jgi:cytochrome c peroxidase